MNPYWSYLLTAVGVFGLWLAGRRDRRGWMVGIFAQVLWIAYAFSTKQWGFLVSALAYGWVDSKNARAWRVVKETREPLTRAELVAMSRRMPRGGYAAGSKPVEQLKSPPANITKPRRVGGYPAGGVVNTKRSMTTNFPPHVPKREKQGKG